MFAAPHTVREEGKTEAKIGSAVHTAVRVGFFVAPAPLAKEKILKKKKILVVDDFGINRKVLIRMLADCECIQASDGHEAVNEVKKALAIGIFFDLILMDLEMPVMNGNSATLAIRNLNSQAPIICVSTTVNNRKHFDTLTSGMDDFLNKPVKRIELDLIVKKYSSLTVLTSTNTESEEKEIIKVSSPSSVPFDSKILFFSVLTVLAATPITDSPPTSPISLSTFGLAPSSDGTVPSSAFTSSKNIFNTIPKFSY